MENSIPLFSVLILGILISSGSPSFVQKATVNEPACPISRNKE